MKSIKFILVCAGVWTLLTILTIAAVEMYIVG